MEWMRHLVRTIGMRAQVALENVPSTFAEFEAGGDVRRPIEILEHMTGLMVRTANAYQLQAASREAAPQEPTPSDWEGAVHRFFRQVDAMLDALTVVSAENSAAPETDASSAPSPSLSEEVLIQGPLADCLTHIGQLLTLRRLAGFPAEPVSYPRIKLDASVRFAKAD